MANLLQEYSLPPAYSGRIDSMFAAKKELGQHWLYDEDSLLAMCEGIALSRDDTVLEIGPGLGTLTAKLAARAKKVIAVELDASLARELPGRVPAKNLEVVHQDILKFDLTTLPRGYKLAANIPYYLTSNLLRLLLGNERPFSKAALLMQKEVARRAVAGPGDMSLLSVSVQLYAEARLGVEVPAELFNPQPKVDSQILLLEYRKQALYPDLDTKKFFRIVKAGFAQKRKTLLNALSAGLQLSREETEALLEAANIFPAARAQNLSLTQWYDLYRQVP